MPKAFKDNRVLALLFLSFCLFTTVACKGPVGGGSSTIASPEGNGEGCHGKKPNRQVIPQSLLAQEQLFKENRVFYKFTNETCMTETGAEITTYSKAIEFTPNYEILEHGTLCSSATALAENLDTIEISKLGNALSFQGSELMETDAEVDRTLVVPSDKDILTTWCAPRYLNRRYSEGIQAYMESRVYKQPNGAYILKTPLIKGTTVIDIPYLYTLDAIFSDTLHKYTSTGVYGYSDTEVFPADIEYNTVNISIDVKRSLNKTTGARPGMLEIHSDQFNLELACYLNQ